MFESPGRSLIVVTSQPGFPAVAELQRLASNGEIPRRDYVELSRALDADVLDAHYMECRASRAGRAIAQHGGFLAGQLIEAVIRGGRYRHVIAWADRLGLPLAAAHKIACLRRDVVMLSVRLSPPKKAVFLRRLRVHSHLRAIANYGTVQMEFAAALGVPREKLFHAPQPVDDRFWRPSTVPPQGDVIAAAGSEGRDYATLLSAVRGLDARLELAVGNSFSVDGHTQGGKEVRARMGDIDRAGVPPNVGLSTLNAPRLRELYARARFVVVPLQDLDYDAGVAAIVEAVAMAKAVIVTQTRGQVDVLRDGEQGIYVPPGDPRAMRAAIEHLLANPEQADQMGRAGRALVERRHTLDGFIAKLVGIVRSTDEVAHEAGANRSPARST